MVCPVCGKKSQYVRCPDCGFDSSRDYERYPTLAPVGKTPAVSALQKEWQKKGKTTELPRKKRPWMAMIACAAMLVLGIGIGAGFAGGKQASTEPNESVQKQVPPETALQAVLPETTVQTTPMTTTPTPVVTVPPAPEITAPISRVNPVYLVDLRPSDTQGKLWLHLESGGSRTETSSLGYIRAPIRDLFGNSYENGIHVDGYGKNEFSLTYVLEEDYTTFSGWVVYLDNVTNPNEYKIVDIYCDGVLQKSFTMTRNSRPEQFSISLEGVRELRIVYPATMGSNDMAAICDGLLE